MGLAGGPSPPQLSPGEGGVTGALGTGRLSPGRLKGMETYMQMYTLQGTPMRMCTRVTRHAERQRGLCGSALTRQEGEGGRLGGAGSPSDSNRRGGMKGRGGELRAHGCRYIFASAQMGTAWAVRGPGPGAISPPGRASRWEGVSEATP